MRVERRRCRDVVVLTTSGWLGRSEAPGIVARLGAMIDDGDRRLVLDLRRLGLLDADSLANLLALLRRVRERGGETVLVRPDAPLRTLLSDLGLTQVLHVFDSMQEGIRHHDPDADVGEAVLDAKECDVAAAARTRLRFRPLGVDGVGVGPWRAGRILTFLASRLLFVHELRSDARDDSVTRVLRVGGTLALRLERSTPSGVDHLELRGRIVHVTEDGPNRLRFTTVRFEDPGPDARKRLGPFGQAGDGGGAAGVFAREKRPPPGGAGHATTE